MAPGTFPADDGHAPPEPRERDRPAAVMLLAPVIGAAIWGAILYLVLA